MNEKLLQYVWQQQYFNRSALFTSEGEPLLILSPGKLNQNQGPDFENALVKIGSTVLAGSIELHLKTSQWNARGHQNDPNYSNVILHVVYQHDLDHHHLPVLELEPRIPLLLHERYNSLMQNPAFIACAGSMQSVPELTWRAWKDRLMAERLTRKSKKIGEMLAQEGKHWEQICWLLLARNFGAKVNADAFEAMARSLPQSILSRHRNQIQQLEALMLGQAGLLRHHFSESYPRLLQREYHFLRKKYGLAPITVPIHFLRMRPGNFPTLRLAQLAALHQKETQVFSRILEISRIEQIETLFSVTANDYWHYHYRFDELTEYQPKKIGAAMISNLVINTVAPLQFAYGLYRKEEKYQDQALRLLDAVEKEDNAIIRGFLKLQVGASSAFDSQALIELKTQYCDQKRCLQCAVGAALLKIT